MKNNRRVRKWGRDTLINKLINKFNYKRYLEIGVDTGKNFRRVKCESKISVDPRSSSHVHPTYTMTSDQFFAEIAPELELFDVIFIDGLHETSQVDKDIRNSLKRLSKNGFIILHDCNPETREFEELRLSGDVWKSIAKLSKNVPLEYGYLTINADWGLGVISTRISGRPNLKTIPDELTYEWLSENRYDILRLIERGQFESYINNGGI